MTLAIKTGASLDSALKSTVVSSEHVVHHISTTADGTTAVDPATSTLQTAAATLTGAVNETAPASDTASSGLNGRLQRIAQRITSLIALLPTALGQGTMAQSLKVAIASDQSALAIKGNGVTYTDKSGTVTSGGVAQTPIVLNASRRGFWIQNQSTSDLWISTVGTAAATQPSLRIPAGALYEAPATGVPTAAVSLFGATTGQAFAAREW